MLYGALFWETIWASSLRLPSPCGSTSLSWDFSHTWLNVAYIPGPVHGKGKVWKKPVALKQVSQRYTHCFCSNSTGVKRPHPVARSFANISAWQPCNLPRVGEIPVLKGGDRACALGNSCCPLPRLAFQKISEERMVFLLRDPHTHTYSHSQTHLQNHCS